MQEKGLRHWEGVGDRVKKRKERSYMAIRAGGIRKTGLLIVWVVNMDERCGEISPDFPKAMSIRSGMGGRQCGDWSTQGSGSPD